MLSRIRKSMEDKDQGFTLIELLVVIIIIGILAAVAIPVFLNQRKKGWDAAVQSDLKNAATAQETYNTAQGHYTDDVADLTANGFKFSAGTNYDGGTASFTVVMYNGTPAATTVPVEAVGGFCIEAMSSSTTVWSYDSTKGGMQAPGTGC